MAREIKLGRYEKENNPNFGNKWSEEKKLVASKRMIGKYTGSKNPNAKKIRRLEDGKIYNTIIEALEDIGVTRSSLYKAMAEKKKTKGWSFEYVKEDK